jgi:hypothetical protein
MCQVNFLFGREHTGAVHFVLENVLTHRNVYSLASGDDLISLDVRSLVVTSSAKGVADSQL